MQEEQLRRNELVQLEQSAQRTAMFQRQEFAREMAKKKAFEQEDQFKHNTKLKLELKLNRERKDHRYVMSRHNEYGLNTARY